MLVLVKKRRFLNIPSGIGKGDFIVLVVQMAELLFEYTICPMLVVSVGPKTDFQEEKA
jgi:hypothetical protein